ncbi:uncharacterized protein LOC106668464 [Cimex lectularius]|uniref:CPR type cuticle protein n=1 Tax=Cimex lectularius TaxID=79782 RepID=A0A8I6TIR6_CIMLE|nr:uncharacterized protein LOC106668464 [Cimex lectularius]
MKLNAIFLFVLIAFIEFTWCRPRYIAIPIEDVEFLEMSTVSKPQFRIPREGQLHAVQDFPQEQTPRDNRYQRQASGGHHDHVDYGAHTGHHGSFGWYAEFPVHKAS